MLAWPQPNAPSVLISNQKILLGTLALPHTQKMSSLTSVISKSEREKKSWGGALDLWLSGISWLVIHFPIYKYCANESRIECVCQLSSHAVENAWWIVANVCFNGCLTAFRWYAGPRAWRCTLNHDWWALACFSGVRECSSAATSDVDVKDVCWSHGEAAVAQLAVPEKTRV